MTEIPENTACFSTNEVVRAANAEVVQPGLASSFEGVATDSRRPLPGKLFVALRGERFDGHAFVQAAATQGAAAVMVDESAGEALRLPSHLAVFRVKDTLVGLLALARMHRERFLGPVVAIGGSAGKTTTRSLTSALLGALRSGQIHSTAGNLNNQIGVAMTLLALPLSRAAAVLELGTNSPGEIRVLCETAQPTIGVLTLVDLEHTEGLINLDGVEAEEGALMDYLARTGGLGIGNADDPRAVRQLGKLSPDKRRSFGYSRSADCCIVLRTAEQDLSSRMIFRGTTFDFSFEAPWVSRHRALGLAAALSVASALFPGEVSADQLQSALGEPLESGRGSLVRHPSGALLMDESYNANPGSCRACIDSAAEIAQALGRRLTLVLGEMRELGLESEREHEALGQYAATASPERALFVGGDACHAAETAALAGVPAAFFATSELARSNLWASLGPGNVVLVKGSRGVRLETLLTPPESVSPSQDSATGASPGAPIEF